MRGTRCWIKPARRSSCSVWRGTYTPAMAHVCKGAQTYRMYLLSRSIGRTSNTLQREARSPPRLVPSLAPHGNTAVYICMSAGILPRAAKVWQQPRTDMPLPFLLLTEKVRSTVQHPRGADDRTSDSRIESARERTDRQHGYTVGRET